MNWTEEQYEEYLAKRKQQARQKQISEPSSQPYIKEISKVNDPAENEKAIFFSVPLKPVTKKNHSRIITIGNYPKLIPSEQYSKYDKAIAPYLRELAKQIGEPIGYPINLQCKFYCDARRQSDLVGHLQSIQDLLVKYKCLEDDCRDIVASTNGSVVLYDKENPRTEIIITAKEGYEQWAKKRKSSK